MKDYMKSPCGNCPFRSDLKPFLTPNRGADLACLSTNPYNSFPCHKTAVSDGDGSLGWGEKTKHCAGFTSMQVNNAGDNFKPEGFEVSDLVYEDAFHMEQVYTDPDEYFEK